MVEMKKETVLSTCVEYNDIRIININVLWHEIQHTIQEITSSNFRSNRLLTGTLFYNAKKPTYTDLNGFPNDIYSILMFLKMLLILYTYI